MTKKKKRWRGSHRETNVDSVNEDVKKTTKVVWWREGLCGNDTTIAKSGCTGRSTSKLTRRSKLESPARCLNEKKVASSSDGRGIETKKVSIVFFLSLIFQYPSRTSDVRPYSPFLSAPLIPLDFVHPFRHPKHHVSPLEKSSFENSRIVTCCFS